MALLAWLALDDVADPERLNLVVDEAAGDQVLAARIAGVLNPPSDGDR